MTKPTFIDTDASSAINTANDAIDRQAGGAGEQAKATRAELNRAMAESDAVISNQQSGGSPGRHSEPQRRPVSEMLPALARCASRTTDNH